MHKGLCYIGVMPNFNAAEVERLFRPAGSWSYHQEWRRCKPGTCKTCDAGGRHGPYRYAVRRVGDRVQKRYVGKHGYMKLDD